MHGIAAEVLLLLSSWYGNTSSWQFSFGTGCSTAYNISHYPQFKDVNTQVVEQSNSILKRAKSSLSYMNKQHFLII